MLHALLGDKLGRLVDDEGQVASDAGAAFPRLEDPLTAAVFSRLRYLPTSEWWSLLGAALEVGDRWPSVPSGVGQWRFWPSLRPGVGGNNSERVEPDVLVVFDDLVVVIEAKHRQRQSGRQWREQLLAVSHHHEFRTRSVAILAVGGLDPSGFGAERAALASAGVPCTAHFLAWPRLRDVLAGEETSSPQSRLIRADARDAIVHWGYRPTATMGSLVEARDLALRGRGLASRLPRWAPASAGLARLVGSAGLHRPLGSTPLPRWSTDG